MLRVDERRRPPEHELRVGRLVARHRLEAQRVGADGEHGIERLVELRGGAVLEREVFLLGVPHRLADTLALRDQVREVVGAIRRLPPQIAGQHVAHREERIADDARAMQARRDVGLAALPVGGHDDAHAAVGGGARASRTERDADLELVAHLPPRSLRGRGRDAAVGRRGRATERAVRRSG